MALQTIKYSGDGIEMSGHLALPKGPSPWPGVLVAHEAPGMNDRIKAKTQALADMGYAAFALDMYGLGAFPLSQAMTHHAAMMATPARMFTRSLAALTVLSAQPGVDPTRLAAIGFCQGGVTALELARGGAPVLCAIGFHPGLTRPVGSPNGPIEAKVLMMIGDDDPVIPHEHRTAFSENMKSIGADWQLHIFGGVGHTYTNPDVDALGMPGFAYNADADRRSWAMMANLLAESFAV